MRQPHQPPLPNTTLQICIAPKTEPLVVVCAYEKRTHLESTRKRALRLEKADQAGVRLQLSNIFIQPEVTIGHAINRIEAKLKRSGNAVSNHKPIKP